MLEISHGVMADVRAHAVETYPHECCGFLIGRPGQTRHCSRSVRADNQRTDRAWDRYEIDPLAWLRLERILEASGDAIIGIYHSHPDHPSKPSEFDRDHAHPRMSYIILEITAAGVQSERSWTLDDQHQFEQETMVSGGPPVNQLQEDKVSVTVRIPLPLQKMTKDQATVQIDGGSVAEVIAHLEAQYPGVASSILDERGQIRRFVNIFVNEDNVKTLGGEQAKVKDGDEISIIPAIAGG